MCLHSLPGHWCLGHLLLMRTENGAWRKLCESVFYRDCRPVVCVQNPMTSSKRDSTGRGFHTVVETRAEDERNPHVMTSEFRPRGFRRIPRARNSQQLLSPQAQVRGEHLDSGCVADVASGRR